MARIRRCRACKARKIKCDGASPDCFNCLRRCEVCPGYRVEVAFRDMRQIAEIKVETRVDKILRNRELAKLHAQIEGAVDEFFTDYVVPSDVAKNNSWFIKELYTRSNANHAFQAAVKAAALQSKANKSGGNHMFAEANNAYSEALSSLAESVRKPSQSRDDSTLGTAWMLGLCEFISGNNRGTFNILTATHHHHGRVSLLQARGLEQFNSALGKCLVGFMIPQLSYKCIITKQRPPSFSEEWFELCEFRPPSFVLEKINFRTANFCVDAQILFDAEVEDEAWAIRLQDLIKTAESIDFEYEKWAEEYTHSDPWGYRVLSADLSSSSPNCTIRTYCDLWVGALWLGYLSKRGHLQHILLHCITLLEDHGLIEKKSSATERPKSIMNDMASSICSSVPFMLGIVDSTGSPTKSEKRSALGGYVLVYPLHIARWSVQVGGIMDDWIVSVQKSISTTMGIQSAANIAAWTRKMQWRLF